ncbi:LptA/OstA family protein [Rhodoligotrophos defluvii]|uniref:LptA/OstA family protein n=1 Tax=Rhodoligotrophos defluvii TaxID=2561934 RepID=UPI0010C974E1|nr:LptA/OstA family protein [Rhodoligotrophos defluvii]
MLPRFEEKRKRSKSRAGLALFCAAAISLVSSMAAAQSVDASKLKDASGTSNSGAVDILAEKVELNQERQQAVFTGSVDATRGNVRLKSQKLVVDYEEVKTGDRTERKFKSLQADGNVVVTSRGQVINADWAKMDVPSNKIVMGGNVVVTQGQTVLRGNQLNIDLNTGQSQLSGGRVRGRFVP